MGWTVNLALGIYGVSLVAYTANYITTKAWLRKAGLALLVLAWGAHTVSLAWRWTAAGRAPVSNQYESLLVLAWSVVALYLLFEWRNTIPLKGMGFWVGLVAILGLGGASLLDASIEPLVPALRSNWLLIHVVITMIGYAALALAAVTGGIVLVCHRKHSGPQALPLLDGLMYRMLSLGVLFLGMGIMAGAIWANSAWGSYWSWDPKETWSLVTWMVYLITLHQYKSRGWRGVKFAAWVLAGFGFVLFTYFGVNYLLRGLHSYA